MSSDGTPRPGPEPVGGNGTTSHPPPSGARRPRVGMALYGDVTFDSRVRKEARTLAEAGYDVVVACLASHAASPDLPAGVRVIVLRPPGPAVIPGSPNPFLAAHGGRLAAVRGRVAWLLSYVRGLRAWGRLVVETAGPVDVWHAHDLTGLAAIMPNLPRRSRVVYDSHELFLETGTALRLPAAARLVLRAYERRLVSRVSAVITVNEALASVFRRRYRRLHVLAVHNCPDRWSPPIPRPTVLREVAGVSADATVILYHGALSANRGVEQLMQVLLESGFEDAHLVLLGFGEMRADFIRASAEARWKNRVHVLDPVPPAELMQWVASADIGAMPIQPSTLNHRLSTPNKLFECLAAGIPVVASDFPTMRRIIIGDPGGPLGAVCDPMSVESIADAIRSIVLLSPADKDALRARCLRAAAERWNWELEGDTLVSVYSEIMPRRR
jgi:glycosyltransferase involved in cell wall biosynthesis